MSYQVLARKWRPKNFASLVGQEYAVRVLQNALATSRLHHGYLFTGTRGVGKTTIARIFAKALNCEEGIVSEPCGKCTVCIEIDQGKFIDLIELDAASHTGVDNMRDILEQVQFSPTKGRFKIYIIDEVHMLSGSAFNAMLKTLEEPPEHVKFIFATTNAQKIPVTILSRCLQFSLKQMTAKNVAIHLEYILTQENIAFEKDALVALSEAASGSMRDALSLLDQAIAYGNGSVLTQEVRTMLGGVDKNALYSLLENVLLQDSQSVMAQIYTMQENNQDFESALNELAKILQRIASMQIVPDQVLDESDEKDWLLKLSQKATPEQIQLCYQIAILGRRDLDWSPSHFVGFSMTILRMLAFELQTEKSRDTKEGRTASVQFSKSTDRQVSTANAKTIENVQAIDQAKSLNEEEGTGQNQVLFDGNWRKLTDSFKNGLVKSFAQHCVLTSFDAQNLYLNVPENHRSLVNDTYKKNMADLVAHQLGNQLRLHFQIGDVHNNPRQQIAEEKVQQETEIQEKLEADKNVHILKNTLNARQVS